MVQCIADRGNYFLLTTAPIALVAYFTVCLSRSSLVFKALVSLTMAQVVYALLAFNFEDTFHVDFGGQMALTLFALAGTTMLLMSVVAGVVLFFAATTLLTPVLYHNSALLGEFLDRHFDVKLGFWASTILFCVLLGVLLALLVLSRFFRVIGYGLRIVLASLAVFISAQIGRAHV